MLHNNFKKKKLNEQNLEKKYYNKQKIFCDNSGKQNKNKFKHNEKKKTI